MLTEAHREKKKKSYLCDLSDLLRDVLGSVFNFAGRDDFNFSGRRRSHAVRAEGESNLRDTADGPVSHQVRVRCGVQSAGLQVCNKERQQSAIKWKRKFMNGGEMWENS